MAQAQQIVHESETQRQFIRLQLPATMDVKGQSFTVKDLSSGGLSIRAAGKHFKKGEMIAFILQLPFAGFTLDLDMKGEILHIQKDQDIAGCRFTDLTTNQISVLNHVIKSFMSGDLVGADDLIHVVSRENFVNVRKQTELKSLSPQEQIKKYAAYAAIIFATFLLAAFIIGNIMNRLFVVTSPMGVVETAKITMLAPQSGIVQLTLPEGRLGVQKNQIMGTITPSGGQGAVNLISPCNCTILAKNTLSGEYKSQDTALFTLLPNDSDILVSAQISVEDIHRLPLGSKAVFKISGVSDKMTGKIERIEMTEESAPLSSAAQPLTPTAKIIIRPDNKISGDWIGRPVFVEVHI